MIYLFATATAKIPDTHALETTIASSLKLKNSLTDFPNSFKYERSWLKGFSSSKTSTFPFVVEIIKPTLSVRSISEAAIQSFNDVIIICSKRVYDLVGLNLLNSS